MISSWWKSSSLKARKQSDSEPIGWFREDSRIDQREIMNTNKSKPLWIKVVGKRVFRLPIFSGQAVLFSPEKVYLFVVKPTVYGYRKAAITGVKYGYTCRTTVVRAQGMNTKGNLRNLGDLYCSWHNEVYSVPPNRKH
jgi:hypothetical protein